MASVLVVVKQLPLDKDSGKVYWAAWQHGRTDPILMKFDSAELALGRTVEAVGGDVLQGYEVASVCPLVDGGGYAVVARRVRE